MDAESKEAFRNAVCDIVRLVPRGRATSYGAIARAAGYPNHSRMVGRILAEGCGEGIPAHRVVGSGGLLSGRGAFGGEGQMQRLLESEGVAVENNRICGWQRVFWNPLDEI